MQSEGFRASLLFSRPNSKNKPISVRVPYCGLCSCRFGQIATFLSIRELAALSATSKTMREWIWENQKVWESLFQRDFHNKRKETTKSWRQAYLEYYILGQPQETTMKTLSMMMQNDDSNNNLEHETTRISLNLFRISMITRDPKKALSFLTDLKAYHKKFENHVEAAHCSLLQATLVTDQKLLASFLQDAIVLFDQSMYWESGLEVLREMEERKIANEVIRQIGDTMKNKIRDAKRFFPQYYSIEFSGTTNDVVWNSVSGRHFVVRGRHAEKLQSVVALLKTQWPNAEIEQTVTSKQSSSFIGIRIHAVNPLRLSNDKNEKWSLDKDKIIRMTSETSHKNYSDHYSSQTNLNFFTFTKPNPKVKSDDLVVYYENFWSTEYLLHTRTSLPGPTRWAEVIEETTVERTPIENAIQICRTQVNRCEETLQSTQNYLSQQSIPPNGAQSVLSALAMAVNGIVASNVSGGVFPLVNAFLTMSKIEHNREQSDFILELTDCIEKLNEIVRKSLDLLKKGMKESKLVEHITAQLYPVWEKEIVQSVTNVHSILQTQPIDQTKQNAINLLSIDSELPRTNSRSNLRTHHRAKSTEILSDTPKKEANNRKKDVTEKTMKTKRFIGRFRQLEEENRQLQMKLRKARIESELSERNCRRLQARILQLEIDKDAHFIKKEEVKLYLENSR